MITNLKPNQVFVFGSNLAGHHFGGAAQQAREQFGAENGVGEGMTGQCYAFPTLNEDFYQRSKNSLITSIQKLYECCRANPDKEFLLTKVGCGIAGYRERTMKYLFADSPSNLIKPNDWKI
jgi:hypothetical protein